MSVAASLAKGPVAGVARALLAAAYALPLWYLWAEAPFDRFLPPTLLGAPMDALVIGSLGLLAFAASYRARFPLGALAAVATAALLVVLYPHSRLDWSRLLKNWGLVADPVPVPLALVLAVAPFVALWGLHALTLRERVAKRYVGKGVPDTEVDLAVAGVAHAARRALVTALAGTALLAVAYLALAPATALIAAWTSGLAFAGPILAAGAIALALWVLLKRRGATEG